MPLPLRHLALPAVLAAVLVLPGCGSPATGPTAALGAAAPALLQQAVARSSTALPSTALPSTALPSSALPSTALSSGAQASPRPCHPQPALPAPGDAEPLRATIAVVVPATTLVRLDGAGRPASARTNTGQAPCRTDVFVVARGDVTEPAPPAVRAAVLTATAGVEDGGWTAGAWRPLAPGA